ncbi:MAG: cyclase family protein [Phycisphaeraceae bacterium]|nr:cyclase family protein [Phycisphaeraceae bacterium]
MLHDLSPSITPATAVWPGDTPFSRKFLCRIADGAPIDLSTITTTVHLGAHADGPNHYHAQGVGIGEMPLIHYLGLCQVVDAPVPRGGRVTPSDLPAGVESIRAPRVLFRTGTFDGFNAWNDDFAGLSPELIDALAALPIPIDDTSTPEASGASARVSRRSTGVITVGLDTPSVDLQHSKDLPAHHAVFRHGMAILEGLELRTVPPGVYELIALPLKLVGCDASPVRAVLRSLPDPAR